MKKHQNRSLSNFISTTATAALLWCCVAAEQAQGQSTYNWNGGGASGNWSDGNNWGGTGPSTPQAFLNFDGSTRLNNTNNLGNGGAGYQIYFKSSAGAFGLYGNSINFYDFGGGDPNIQNEGTANAQTINFAINNGNTHGVNGILNINVNTGTAQGPLVFNGAVSAADANLSPRAINISGTNTVAFNGPISDFSASGKIALTQLGTSTTTLNATNTFSGALTISAGTVVVGTKGLLGNGNYSTAFANNGTLIIGANNNQTLSGAISGSGKLTKTGSGTLTLGGATDTFTGGLNLNAGTTILDFNAAGSPSANLLSSSTILTNNGANLTLSGSSTSASSQTFASTTFGPGNSVISAAPASGANNPTLALGGLTFQLGSTVRFVGPATINGGGNVAATANITTTTIGQGGAAAPFGLLLSTNGVSQVNMAPAFATLATVGLYDWASTDTAAAGAGTSPYTLIGGSQVAGFYTTTFPNAAGNWDMTANTALATATKTASSIRFNTPAATTLTLNSIASGTQCLLANEGGFLVTPNMGANNVIIQPSAAAVLGAWQIARVTTPTGPQEGVVWQNNTAGYLNFYAPILDGRDAGDTNHIVKAGAGTVWFYGVNSYNGPTYVNEGVLAITNISGLGNSASAPQLFLNGGTLFASNTVTVNLDNGTVKRPVTLLGNGGGLAANTGTTLSVSGVVGSGANTGPLTIGIAASAANGSTQGRLPGSGSGTANTTALTAAGTVVLTNANFYTGGTILESGTLNINGINALGGANYGGVTFNGGTLQYAASFSGNGSGDLTSIGTAGVTLASGTGTIDVNGNSVTYAGSIGNGGAGALTLKSTAANGVLTLSSGNNYSGGTTIQSGTVKANNTSGSAFGSGNVSLTGGTLGGNGSFTGTLTVANGATVAPGNSIGALTVGALTMSSGSLYNIEFNSNPTNDQIVVTSSGGLTVNGGAFNLYVENSVTAWTTLGTYKLVAYSGSIGGSGLDSTWTTASASNPHIGNPQSGFTYSFDTTSNPGYISVVIAAGSAVGTWSSPTDGNWSVAGNWTATSGTMPPSQPGDAAILGTASALRTVNLDANETVGGLTFNNANSFIVGNANNSTLKLNNSGGNASVVVSGGTANAIATPVALSDNSVVSLANGTALSITSLITNTSGSKTLTATGPGTLTLSGANNYGPAAGSTGTTLSNGVTVAVANATAFGPGDVAVTGSSTIKAGAALTVANNVAISSGVNATVDNNANSLSLSGVISGSGSLTKTNGGTLTLGGANTYSGGTVINDGVLSVGSDANLGGASGSVQLASSSANLLISGTTTLASTRGITIGAATGTTGSTALIDVSSGQTATVGGVISSAGNTGANELTVNSGAGTGTLNLGGANTYTGPTRVKAGTLSISNALALQSSTLLHTNSGTVTFASGITAATFGALSGNQNLSLNNADGNGVTLTVGGNGTAATYSGSLTGGGSLTKSGSGGLTLTGANTYTNATTAGGGVLLVTNGGSITANGPINVSTTGGSQLLVNGGTVTTTAGGNVGSGSAGISVVNGTLSYGGALTTDQGAANGNLIAVTGGTLSASSLSLGRTGLINNSQPTAGNTANGLYVNGGTVSISGAVNAGTSALNNSSVNARIDAGTLTVGGPFTIGLNNAGRWSDLDVSGGTLNINDTTTGLMIGGPFSGNAVFLVRGGTTTVGKITFGQPFTNNTTVSSVLNQTAGNLYIGSGGLAYGTSSNTPTIQLVGGILGAAADWSSDSQLTITLNGTTIQCADAGSVAHNITLNGQVTGASGLSKTGTGTLNLNGANNYVGATSVSAGKLAVNGSTASGSAITIASGATLGGTGTVNGTTTISAGGTLAPGNSIGTLTLAGNVNLNASATTLLEINRTNAQTADKVNKTGSTLTLNGTLTVTNIGEVPQASDVFNLFDGTLAGSFATVNLPYAPAHWDTSDLAVGGTITFTGNATPTANDLNLTRSSGVSYKVSKSALGVDADGDALTYNITTTTNGATLTQNANSILVPASTVDDEFTYTVTDSLGYTSSAGKVHLAIVAGTGQTTASITTTGGNPALTFYGIPGNSYTIQVSTDLSNWTDVNTSTAGSTGVITYTDTAPPTPAAYYRLKAN